MSLPDPAYDIFRLGDLRGGAFYPFPAAIFPLNRTGKPGIFAEVLRNRRFETDYYTGPTPSAG